MVRRSDVRFPVAVAESNYVAGANILARSLSTQALLPPIKFGVTQSTHRAQPPANARKTPGRRFSQSAATLRARRACIRARPLRRRGRHSQSASRARHPSRHASDDVAASPCVLLGAPSAALFRHGLAVARGRSDDGTTAPQLLEPKSPPRRCTRHHHAVASSQPMATSARSAARAGQRARGDDVARRRSCLRSLPPAAVRLGAPFGARAHRRRRRLRS